MKLTALKSTGGKGINSVPQGPWVASMLPRETNVCYVEPFGRFCGTLLQRKPSRREIINDIDWLVITWWRQLRDNTEDLIWQLAHSPHSRVEFDEAQQRLRSGEPIPPLEKARLFTICIENSITHTMDGSGFSMTYSVDAGGKSFYRAGYWERKLPALAARMKNVTLECKPAAELLDRLAGEAHCIIYCDPPYPTASNFYGNDTLDVDELTDVLIHQAGRVAISGYDSEWSHLCSYGWEEHECPGLSGGNVGTDVSGKGIRREKLWTNYPAQQQGKLL